MKPLAIFIIGIISSLITIPTQRRWDRCVVLEIPQISVNDIFVNTVKKTVIPYVKHWKKSPETYIFIVEVFEEKESEDEVYIAGFPTDLLQSSCINEEKICAFSIIEEYRFFFYSNAESMFRVNQSAIKTFTFQTMDIDYGAVTEWLFKVDSLGLRNYLVPPMPYAQ